MPFVSIWSNVDKNIESERLTLSIRTNSNVDDWQRVGAMEISKKVGRNVPATQKVQVYKNTNGDRAVKDNYGYHEIKENKMYGKYPEDDCFECGYRYKVFYEGDYWYTKGIVKQY